jgi:predicted metal-dependent phosphoesterase TrpH
MSELVDLHIHSNRSSDGDYSPAELIRMARESGFCTISIADHDTTEAYPEAIAKSRDSGVEVIPSVEVTTLFDSREFHVLLPFLDWESPVVSRVAARVSAARDSEARERVEKLGELGIDISWEEVEEKCQGTPPLGVTIAQILLDKPESRRNPVLKKYYDKNNQPLAPYHFYKDYFLEGRPAFVPKRHMPLLEVLELAPGAGAVPVLAHPGAYFENATREDLVRLKENGLAGVEVYTSYHQPEQTALYFRIAAELDLVPTAGSDFHGRIKPHVPFGYIRDGRPWMVDMLRERRP